MIMGNAKIDLVDLAAYIVEHSPSPTLYDSYERIMETWDDDTIARVAFDIRTREYDEELRSPIEFCDSTP